MIYTEITHITRYKGLGEHLDKLIDYLTSHSLEELKNGRNEVDGDYAYINCFEYETLPEEETIFEAHEKYADIHMMISGKEKMGVSDVSVLTITKEDKEADYVLGNGPTENYVTLKPGAALIVFPEDAHKVKIMADGGAEHVRKAVGKVLVK